MAKHTATKTQLGILSPLHDIMERTEPDALNLTGNRAGSAYHAVFPSPVPPSRQREAVIGDEWMTSNDTDDDDDNDDNWPCYRPAIASPSRSVRTQHRNFTFYTETGDLEPPNNRRPGRTIEEQIEYVESPQLTEMQQLLLRLKLMAEGSSMRRQIGNAAGGSSGSSISASYDGGSSSCWSGAPTGFRSPALPERAAGPCHRCSYACVRNESKSDQKLQLDPQGIVDATAWDVGKVNADMTRLAGGQAKQQAEMDTIARRVVALESELHALRVRTKMDAAKEPKSPRRQGNWAAMAVCGAVIIMIICDGISNCQRLSQGVGSYVYGGSHDASCFVLFRSPSSIVWLLAAYSATMAVCAKTLQPS